MKISQDIKYSLIRAAALFSIFISSCSNSANDSGSTDLEGNGDLNQISGVRWLLEEYVLPDGDIVRLKSFFDVFFSIESDSNRLEGNLGCLGATDYILQESSIRFVATPSEPEICNIDLSTGSRAAISRFLVENMIDTSLILSRSENRLELISPNGTTFFYLQSMDTNEP